MSLKIQIISLLLSFIYGIIFSKLLNINYKIIYNDNIIVKIVGTFIYITFSSILYFIILLKINNGIVHIYLLLSILLGFIVQNKMCKKV